MPRARSLTVLLLAFALGCSGRGDAPAPGGTGGDLPAAGQPPADGPEEVRYDLVRHLPRAEQRQGGALVHHLGGPGGHQLTLGGWRTRFREQHRFSDGTRTMVLGSVTGFLRLPMRGGDHCTVTLRARAFGDGRVTIYDDQTTIGHARLPRDGSFGIIRATFPEERCTAGEHDLRFRVSSTGSDDGVSGAGLAIDWLRLGPAGDAEAEAEAEVEVGPPVTAGTTPNDQPGLTMAAGQSVTYGFEVPADGSALRVSASGEGRLSAQIWGETGPPLESRDIAPDRSVRVPLPEAGRWVRVRLVARGGPVMAIAPRVVSPRVGEPRSLASRPRNVLIYLTDTLRADKLTVYNAQTRVETPGLSGWARQAATFLAGHTQENWTKPSCATLLTGLHPWEHQATTEDAQVPRGVTMISEDLRAGGFHTGAFIANGFVSDRFGFRQGWDTFRNYIREGRRNQARFVAADVLAWLDERPTDRPFFLYVHTIDPHVPYIPPADLLRRYDPDPYSGPVDFTRDRELLEKIKSGRLRTNARDRVRLEALYDGEITYHDTHFAAVMQALETRGLADETIVVFTSDHGEELFDHGSVGHGHSVWEELLNVPFLVRLPGVTDAGMRLETPVGLVDVMPTIYEALQRELPEGVSGRSFLPMMLGRAPSAPRATVSGFMNGWRTIVLGRHKLIQRTTAHISLYDLEADPGETNDIAGDHPAIVRTLRAQLGLELAQAESRYERERTVIDDVTRQQLEALGYGGASRAPTEQ